MKKLGKIVLAAGILAIAGGALADNPPTLINDNPNLIIDSGFYFGVHAGYGFVNEKVVGATKSKKAGFTGGLDFGYQFIPYFAAELGGYYVPTQSYTVTDQGFTDVKIKGGENYMIYLAGKGILPFRNGLNLFAKLGGAWVHHKLDVVSGGSQTNSRIAFMDGVGVGYNFTQNVSMSIQGLMTWKSGNVPAYYLGLLGVTYHF